MYFDVKSVGTAPEILASNDYQAVPMKIDETEAVKAGMPITNEGKKAPEGTNAIGILLYDVDPTHNPNGAVVVDGIVNWSKCQKNNGETLNSLTANAIAKLLPNIVFRDKIDTNQGKTYVGGGTAAE